MTDRATEKMRRVEELLEQGMVMVHLDARLMGVAVPAAHLGNHALALNLSYRFEIPDFEISDQGIQASLSFSGDPFPCLLPWDAIFAVRSHVDDSFFVWPEDVPVELLVRARTELSRTSGGTNTVAMQAREPEALVVDGSGDLLSEAAPVGRPTSVPYLRIVK
ncbi:MAG: stringent starvation protein B [Myxococcales bacterium]|nr:stringent starvation protein B [Myxococcales bacterium]